MGALEKFFFVGCQINEIEIKELLLRKYHTLEFIREMSVGEFAEFLILAINKEKKEAIEKQYFALLPTMVLTGKYMTFESFFDTVTGAGIDMRPANEIIKEVEEIKERFEHGAGNI